MLAGDGDAVSSVTDAWCADSGIAPAVVIDTNVWLDLFVFEDRAARSLAQSLQRGSVLALRSPRTDAELLAVLMRPEFASKLSGASMSARWHSWQRLARCAQVDRCAPWLCGDPHDQKFLDLAYSAGAQTLFTKDRALLRLARNARRDGLLIISPDVLSGPHDGGLAQRG